MCKKLVASVDRFDKVVPLTEFLGDSSGMDVPPVSL